MIRVCQKLEVSERRAWNVLGQARTTQRREQFPPSDEKQLIKDIAALVTKYGRYGYRRITALLNNEHGWRVNHKRVEKLWRREGIYGRDRSTFLVTYLVLVVHWLYRIVLTHPIYA